MRNAAAIKAIVWKEMRENANWALAGMVVFSIALFVGAWHVSYHSLVPNASYENLWTECWSTLTFVSLFTGFSLGVAQTAREAQSVDHWARFIHRPASPRTLLVGKVLAGICLYAVATLVPLFMLGIWLYVPGDVAAPFEWSQFDPGVAPLLAGLIAYFAGLIAGAQLPHRNVSRFLPYVTATSIFLIVVSRAFNSLVTESICAAFVSLFLCAAFFGMRSDGEGVNKSTFGVICRSVVNYSGICFVIAAVFIGTIWAVSIPFSSTLNTLQSSRPRASVRETQAAWELYAVDKNGHIVVVRSSSAGSVLSVTDVSGHTVRGPERDGTWAQTDLSDSGPVTDSDPLANQANVDPVGVVNKIGYLNVGMAQPGVVYYDSRRQSLLVYNLATRLQIGSIGMHGYVVDPEGRSADSRLPEPVINILTAGDTANRTNHGTINITMRHDFLSLSSATGVPIVSYHVTDPGDSFADSATWNVLNVDSNSVHYLLTKRRLIVYGPTGSPVMIDRAAFGPINPILSVTLAGQVVIIAQASGAGCPHVARGGPIALTYSPQGVLTSETGLPRMPGPEWSAADRASDLMRRREYLADWHEAESRIDPALILSAALAPPVPLMMVHRLSAFEPPFDSSAAGLADMVLLSNQANAKRFLAASSLFAILSAVLAWLYAKRAGLTGIGAAAWTVGCLLLGVSGLLLLISLHSLPAREVCPSCGKRRLVTNTNCEHCGADWPANVLQPTDIFAASTQRASTQDADAPYDLNFDAGR